MTDALPDRSDSVENTNNKLRGDNMKRLLQHFRTLQKRTARRAYRNSYALLAIAFIGYEWRVHRFSPVAAGIS